MPIPVSTTESEARMAALSADSRDDEALSSILGSVRLETPADAENAMEAIIGRYRSVNPPLDPNDLSDAELDALAFAEACEHVFRGRPSAIVGPIPS